MPYNGSGVFNLNYNWNDDKAAGIKITASRMQAQDADLAAGLTKAITKDGQTAATANLPMNGFKHTGVADGSARDEYLTVGQFQDRSVIHVAETGAANAYVLSPTIALTAYATGQVFWFIPANTNNAAATLNVSALGAKSLKKGGTTDVASGDVVAGRLYAAFYDGTNFQLVNLMGLYNNATSAMTATTVQAALDEIDARLDTMVVGSTFALTGDITAALTASVNDWAPTGIGTASVVRITNNGAYAITGLSGGSDGRVLFLMNTDATNAVTLSNESASSTTAGNRFQCPGAVDYTLGARSTVPVIYDSTTSRWRVVAQFVSGLGIPNFGGISGTPSSSNFLRGDGVWGKQFETPLQTQNPSNASSVVFALDTNYDAFKFYWRNLRCATDGTRLEMYVSIDGGGSYLNTGYDYLIASAGTSNQVFNTTKIQLMQAAFDNTVASSTANGYVTIDNPFSTTLQKSGIQHGNLSQDSTGNFISDDGGIGIRTTSAITHVKFQATSGNIASGSFHMNGFKFA